MKKLIIIIFAFVGVVVNGQLYSTTNLDMMVDSVVVSGADTVGWDTITGAATLDVKFINVDFDITLGYIPCNSKASVILEQADTFKLKVISGDEIRNLNAADTLFIQTAEKVLDSGNDTIITPKRILRILHYSAANDQTIFDIPELQLTGNFTCGSGSANADITAAIALASDNDTIYAFDQTDDAINFGSKDLTIICVGNVKVTRVGATIFSVGTENWYRIKSMNSIAINSNVVQNSSATIDSIIYNNCSLETTLTTGSVINSSADNCNVYLTESFIHGGSTVEGATVLNDCYVDDFNANLFTLNVGADTLIINHSIIGSPSSTGTIRFSDDTYVNLFDSKFLDEIIYNEAKSLDIYFNASYCDMTLTDDNFIMQLTNLDSVEINVSNCKIYNNRTSAGTLFNFSGQNDITFTDNYFYDTYGNAITIDDNNINNATITGNTLISDSSQTIQTTDVNITATGNYMESSVTSGIIASANDVTVGGGIISNNIIISKGVYGVNYQPFIRVGNEDNSNSFGKLNGFIVSGNLCLGPKYYGNDPQAMHGIFTVSQNMSVRFNEVHGALINYLSKHRGNYYNVIYSANKSFNASSLYLAKGAPKTYYYNNLGVNDTVQTGVPRLLHIITDELVPLSYSDSCKIYNNIFYSNSDATIIPVLFDSLPDTVGMEMDYNIIYSKSSSNSVSLQGSSFTLSSWQAEGFDLNSYNTDPNLNANGVPQNPSNAIGNGLNLGAPYNYGLDPSAMFPDPTLRIQRALWSIGAYVPNINTIATSNAKVILGGAGNNRLIHY